MYTDSAYFWWFSPYFRLKWYSILVINSSMVTHPLFFRPHVYGFHLFSAYVLLIFCLFSGSFSASPVLPGFGLAHKYNGHWLWDILPCRPSCIVMELKDFCSNIFWDHNVTWYTDEPDFIQCFQLAILSCAPTILLVFLAPLEIRSLLQGTSSFVPRQVNKPRVFYVCACVYWRVRRRSFRATFKKLF